MSKFNFFILVSTVIAGSIVGWLIYQSPPEAHMGHVQKIMYVHLPSVFLAYILFFVVFLTSWGYLLKRREGYDIHATVSAEIATLYTLITLVTGSLWGKPTWNTYWTWDAKLTVTLILFLIFCGYLIVRRMVDLGETQFRLCAVLGILGFISVPLNHLSVRWWRSIHQSSTIFTTKSTLSDEYKLILYLSFFTFSLLTIYIYRQRLGMEIAYRKAVETRDEMLK